MPYWRLSGFYFCYFALLGTWIPYWALYLKSLGFSSEEIGFLSALVMATKIVAPSLWGWLADTYGHRSKIIRYGAFFAVAIFCGVYFRSDFWWLAAVVVGYSFFWNAVLAQFDVVTLSHLVGRYGHYSRIRVWGSIGFVVAVLGVGWWLNDHPIVHLLYLITALLSGIWLTSLLVAEKGEGSVVARKPTSLLSILRQPAVIAFFAISFFLQLSHGPYYTFFSIYLEGLSYSTFSIGIFWSLGVVAEVLLFIWMHRILAKYSLRNIVLWSLGLSCLRWLLIAFFVQSPSVLFIAQCLHAASFGSYHAAGIEIIRQWFSGHHGQGMALYSGLSFGLGGAAGAVLSGWAWDFGGVYCFVVAAMAAAVAFVIAWRYLYLPSDDNGLS
ncbi:putative 3-phenylpropionic acid transporter [Zhongshania aliphaticivorans]|uniref:Putative 3-phenylpropionic acid transporter n=1 Tax=Zhongshania aliphaticivorans TaxID=1470434 RepID=A0A5S9NIN5_9GAMM|nr:MFS transporter [Zhongshania aliphaticivorans]CAA0089616.1 putative 3-phenylpropionic acid transporter [Zhongshania aliphaticivorans]CAA0096497.1 putative 3-phenylpropionic acid transporter [Zhongshania aliphaticivorans]